IPRNQPTITRKLYLHSFSSHPVSQPITRGRESSPTGFLAGPVRSSTTSGSKPSLRTKRNAPKSYKENKPTDYRSGFANGQVLQGTNAGSWRQITAPG